MCQETVSSCREQVALGEESFVVHAPISCLMLGRQEIRSREIHNFISYLRNTVAARLACMGCDLVVFLIGHAKHLHQILVSRLCKAPNFKYLFHGLFKFPSPVYVIRVGSDTVIRIKDWEGPRGKNRWHVFM
jgi:hypothetical protein